MQGTPFFMAFELLSGLPLHLEDPEHSSLEDTDFLSGSESESESDHVSESEYKGKSEAEYPGPLTPEISGNLCLRRGEIIYNFQYDLESVWWIVLWTLLVRIAHTPGQNYAPLIFVNRLENTPERQSIFLAQGRLRSQLTEVLHKDLQLRFAGLMDASCTKLRQAYRKREQAEEVMQPASYAKIYTTMMLFLKFCRRRSKKGVPDLVSLHQEAFEDPKSKSAGGVEAPESMSTDVVGTSTRSRSKRARSGDIDDHITHGIKRACLDKRLLVHRPPR